MDEKTISVAMWNVVDDALTSLMEAIKGGEEEPWLDYADFELGNPEIYQDTLAKVAALATARAGDQR